MKIKTSELTGAALDWAVARCAGYRLDLVPEESYTPSTNWSQGGPIIEREGIWLTHHKAVKMHGAHKGDDVWFQIGSTPLIAAMRCYVASKFGEVVEISDQLL
jgi:hypothetical protein